MNDTLTVDSLREAMKLIEQLPPIPFFASSRLFPIEHALKFTYKERDYFGLHPDGWKKIADSTHYGVNNQIGSIEIHDLDLHNGKRAEFFDAMAQVMTKPAVDFQKSCCISNSCC